LARESLELPLEMRDSVFRSPPANLELRFAWTSATDTAGEPGKAVILLA
jgi:hypothetical protein